MNFTTTNTPPSSSTMSLEPLFPAPATNTPLPDPAATPPPQQIRFGCFRWSALPAVSLNLAVANGGVALLALIFRGCGARQKIPVAIAAASATAKLASAAVAAMAQRAAARSILRPVEGGSGRLVRKMRYRRWLCWTRFGVGIAILQFFAAIYLMIVMVQDFSHSPIATKCYLGVETKSARRTWVILFLVLTWLAVLVQCLIGSDLLRWRSFYSTHDATWKAHYHEIFDHGIREVMCCLGRMKYLNVSEEDEVYSIARLLGDMVAYRAFGTRHMEFLAGLALLQKCKQSHMSYHELAEAPQARIKEAAACHRFAEAAYTGLLLDFGRNPFLFPCVWIRRHGVLTPWMRGRRPLLEGDNWWRGHAAAFLDYANLHPDSLRKGRICQTRREAAYFVVVLHQAKSIIIAIRGTETPEDVLTDGLCKECALTDDDLDGLMSGRMAPDVREKAISSTHYGHSGIVESARELFVQLDGCSHDTGFLSSLLGEGKECHGYRICIVGHSLGGSVAALLGIKLYGRYPNLHVYAYGPMPCIDPFVAESCSDFITSIVYNDEFSARLSFNSILRLRAAAVAALSSEDSSSNSAKINKLQNFHMNENQVSERKYGNDDPQSRNSHKELHNRFCWSNLEYTIKGGGFLCSHAISCMVNMPTSQASSSLTNHDYSGFQDSAILAANDISESYAHEQVKGTCDPVQGSNNQDNVVLSGALNSVSMEINIDQIIAKDTSSIVFAETGSETSCERSIGISYENGASFYTDGLSLPISGGDSQELFLPGLVVHIVPEQKGTFPQRRGWKFEDKTCNYRAFVVKRENFRDILVTPRMFIDHLPWRCHRALHKVLEAR